MKATITVEDNADGKVDLSCEFDPAVTDTTPYSAAVQLAMDLVQHAVSLARKSKEDSTDATI